MKMHNNGIYEFMSTSEYNASYDTHSTCNDVHMYTQQRYSTFSHLLQFIVSSPEMP